MMVAFLVAIVATLALTAIGAEECLSPGEWTEVNKFSGTGSYLVMSLDGSIVIHSGGQNQIQVYARNSEGSFELRDTITVPDAGNLIASSVSGDGNTVTIQTKVAATEAAVHIFRYDQGTSTWAQVGQTISIGSGNHYQYFGDRSALSNDGNTVALALQYYEANSGTVQVYRFSDVQWTLQSQIVGVQGQKLGHSVSISGDGTKVMVGSSIGDTTLGDRLGSVKVYSEVGTEEWTQLGTTITGTLAGDHYGYFGALSNDGLTFVTSTYWRRELDLENFAVVFRFQGGDWVEIGEPIISNSRWQTLSISSSGSMVVLGDNTATTKSFTFEGGSWVAGPSAEAKGWQVSLSGLGDFMAATSSDGVVKMFSQCGLDTEGDTDCTPEIKYSGCGNLEILASNGVTINGEKVQVVGDRRRREENAIEALELKINELTKKLDRLMTQGTKK